MSADPKEKEKGDPEPLVEAARISSVYGVPHLDILGETVVNLRLYDLPVELIITQNIARSLLVIPLLAAHYPGGPKTWLIATRGSAGQTEARGTLVTSPPSPMQPPPLHTSTRLKLCFLLLLNHLFRPMLDAPFQLMHTLQRLTRLRNIQTHRHLHKRTSIACEPWDMPQLRVSSSIRGPLPLLIQVHTRAARCQTSRIHGAPISWTRWLILWPPL